MCILYVQFPAAAKQSLLTALRLHQSLDANTGTTNTSSTSTHTSITSTTSTDTSLETTTKDGAGSQDETAVQIVFNLAMVLLMKGTMKCCHYYY
jgi:hypothetical protein